jgi:alpha-beta hydrolase superfamily lysophospholipase
LQYALDALGDRALARPQRIVLISPMIGVTALARFAGLFGLPALLPAFAKAAWLSVVPEFNPFKYNSFLTFQSVVDFTVSTRAIVSALYVHLRPNGSELVLFDLNRSATFGPFVRPRADAVLTGLLPDPPRPFRTTVITNASPERPEMVEHVTEAGATTVQLRELGLSYPREVYSLSHIALPFPTSDALYGLEPDPAEHFGVRLGAMAVRGERGTLIVSQDWLARLSSNPFFSYMVERVEEGLGAPRPGQRGTGQRP